MATPAEIKAARDKYLQKLMPAAPVAPAAPAVAAPAPDLAPKKAESVQLGTDLYFQGKSGKTKEQAIAEIQNDVNSAPDFATYAKLSRALQDVDRNFKPGELVAWAGATPVKADEMGILGVSRVIPAPSAFPINAPSQKLTGEQAVSTALRPQIVVGPVSKEFEKPSSVDRAKKLLSDEKFAETLKGKTPEESATLREQLLASRAAIARIIDNLGIDSSDEDVLNQFKIEMEDLPDRLSGKSTRVSAPTVKIEPGKAPNIAAAIYSRQTAGAEVPNLTSAQAAYLDSYYNTAAPRLSAQAEQNLRQKFASTKVPVEAEFVEGPAGSSKPVKTGAMRDRTAEEVDRLVKANLPAEIAKLQSPWWTTSERDDIIRNPEKYATGGGLFETTYPAGATKEGFGAFALRIAMAPINITTTTLTSGTARGGEALGKMVYGDTGEPSTLAAARQRRGGLAASLPDDFVGDLADSVAYNRGAAQQVQDIYKELGLNQNLGFGLGFALDMLAPPVGGIASSSVEAGKSFLAARAAKAAGLVAAEEPLAAAGKAFGNAIRNAWTWKPIDTFPGSIKVLGAEETGKALALREELRVAADVKGAALDASDIERVVTDFSSKNGGGGKLAAQFTEAAARSPESVTKLADEVTKNVASIAQKGEYFSGGSKVVNKFDSVMSAIESGNIALPSSQITTILKNAAGRSDEILSMLETAKTKVPSKLLSEAFTVDPQAVSRAVGSTISFDAFNEVQKAKGFAEFPDLVLVTNRHLSSPKMAAEAAVLAKDTATGKNIASILEGVKTVQTVPATDEMIKINPQRAVQVVPVTDVQRASLEQSISSFQKTGLMTDADAAYARSMLDKGVVPIQGLRYVAEANLDLVIAGKGVGVDANGIRAAARDTTTVDSTAGSWFDIAKQRLDIAKQRLDIAKQQIAQMNAFTPKEMRSSLDGTKLMAEALFKDGKQTLQLLDVPPTTRRAVEDFYNAAGQVDKKLNDLYRTLSGPNAEMRAAYGLPTTGNLTNSQVLTAMARGASVKDTTAFVQSVTDLVLSGYKDSASSINATWMNRSFFSTNTTTYLSYSGEKLVEQLQKNTVEALRSGLTDVNSVIMTMKSELDRILAVESNTTPMYKLIEHTNIDDIPALVGGSLYTREVSIMKDATAFKLMDDPAVNDINNLLPEAIRGVPSSRIKLAIDIEAQRLGITYFPNVLMDGQKLLIKSAITARENGYEGTQGLIRALAENIGVDSTDASVIAGSIISNDSDLSKLLAPHTSAYYNAADQAIRRAGLNSDSIADTVAHILSLNKNNTLPRDLVTGRIVNDSINKFFERETFDSVLKAITKNIPANKQSSQRVLLALDSLVQFVGNVRYNAFLYLRPNYHFGNIVTAPWIVHATLGIENAPSGVDAMYAVRTMRSGPVGAAVGALDSQIAFTDSIGRTFTYGDLRDLGAKSGMFKTEQQVLFSPGALEKIISDAKSMSAPSGVLDALSKEGYFPSDWANSTDNFWRQMSLNQALRMGKPVSVAQEIGRKSLFDFGTLTDAERQFASRFLIFYTFSRVAAENLVKNLSSTAGAARFVRQAAMLRDTSKLVYDMSGGEEYDVRRFYMSDTDLAKATWKTPDVELSQFQSFTPKIPSLDSFMTIAGILYSRGPMESVAGTETGLGQYFDPLIKEGIKSSLEEPAQVTRADKMRLMSPQHVALFVNTESLPVGTSIFGDLTPLHPTKETSTTYNNYEWQMTPEGFEMYSTMRKWASVAGLSSTYDYYGTILAGGVQTPGKSKVLKMIGLGGREVISPAEQEQAVLRMQAEDIAKAAKAREDEQQRLIQTELKQK